MKFFELGEFILKVSGAIVKMFMQIDLGGFDYMTLLVSICVLGITMTSIIIKFKPPKISGGGGRSRGINEEKLD